MIEIWPLWWVDRALTAFSAIMDFESTIFRSIFIRKMIRHSFNYLLMLYVSYNLHESKEVLFVFHPLPNSFQVENSRKIHANPQSLNLTCSNAIMPFIVTSGCPTENRLRRDKVNWAVPTKGENWYKWFQYNSPLTALEMTMLVLHDAKKLLWHKLQNWVVWFDLMPRCENIAVTRGRVQLVQMNSLTWRI